MTFPIVGVVGGGQLARMLAPPAVALGIGLRVLATGPDESAAQVIPDVHEGRHDDLEALLRFAEGCDVVTFDHEHVPQPHLAALADAGVTLRPGPQALAHAQDKLLMRQRLTELGLPCPRWQRVETPEDLERFLADVGGEVVVKTPRGGYDGRGVRVVSSAADVSDWWGQGALLAEERVDFVGELAAMVARSPHGQAVAYPVVQTLQVDGICSEVVAPARIDDDVAVYAQEVALRIAGALDVTGVLAVELFRTPTGILVNELAMRPHNSGHWSIDGAVTSQFENHLRAVLDLPLGDPRPLAPVSVMVNVLGGDYPDLYPAYRHVMARDPELKVHVYGKQVRPGRKVGHVTAVGRDAHDLLERARHAAAYLRGDITE
ncbi:MAG: 5-(carboxyamino)imidazole ribonucleotide synthase [Actinomycetes bacterium]